MAEAMRFAHLPVAGGLYDQHPQLLDEWMIIFHEKSKHDRAEQKKAEVDSKAKSRVAGSKRR